MARFEIKSKDGQSVRFSGKPVYNGSYLKPSSLTFSEINSPSPISWEVGDYVDYTRTGMRYYLYSIPQPSKNANRGTRGDAFSYSGVQFFAATKELEIALFKDIVATDNGIHFSTNPDVSTFENVEGIARRIQACMDYFFPDRWEIRIADFDAVADAEVLEKINTAKDFVLSGGTCLDALSRIYELWQDIGWIHTNENGKEVIIIGYSNKRIDANTSDAYLYGKGRGLTALRKTQTNKEEFATRLYVYGSERNLPSRFYNSKDIHNAESVDIRNLMLPLNKWGQTDGKPDASKAYLENAEAVAKYGLIPKTHYFDSEDAGADIYPTISGMTIGKIREALTALGQTDSAYFPSAELYPDASQRVDKVRWCDNPDDHGDVGDVLLNGSPSMFDGETKSVDVSSGTRIANIVENKLMASAEFSYSESRTCKARFSTAVSGYVNDDGFESVVVKVRLSDSNNVNSSMSKAVEYSAVLNGGKWEFTLPSVEYDYGQIPKAIFGAYVFLTIAVTLPSGSKDKSISYVLNTGIQHLDLYLIMEKTFLLRLHEIGFDIDKQASLGKGKVISMKTGACAGRSFVIESCRHKGGIYTQGYWDLTLKRQKDNTLKLMFPNVNAQIAEGDEFVLTDIAMPDIYVESAMLRLLSEGQKLLARASSIQNLYEPSIDAKVMVEQGRTLREGMFMEISDADVVDNTTDYILIDTLSIHEDESSIPTYKVTLKERRKVTYKGSPSATSTDDTESVEGEQTSADGNVDLTPYAKTEDVNTAISEVSGDIDELSSLLSSMWHLDENGNLVTDKQVLIKNNLIVEQDTSSGGEGESVLVGVQGISVNGGAVVYPNSEGIVELTISGGGGTADLSNYYTKSESDNRYLASSLLGSNTLIHSGNIGSQSVASAKSLVASDGTTYVSYNSTYGQVNVNGINIGYGGNTIERASSGKLYIQKNVTQDTILNIYGGNVGIGTESPSAKLHVDGQINLSAGTNNNYSFIRSENYSSNISLLRIGTCYGYGSEASAITAYNGCVGIGVDIPQCKLDVNGSVAVNEYLIVRAWTGHGSGTCNMWYSGTANTLEISSSVKTMHSLTVTDNLTVNGFAESTYNRNTGMSSTMYFTSTQWLRIWKGPYGSAVRLQIGKNYHHLNPMVLCVDVSVGYSSAAISVTCNTDAANMSIQAIRVTQDASGNYNIDVLVYNAVVNTDVFRVCGNSGLGHIVAFETADNSATVLEQISVVPNASIISNNLIVAGDVASA